MNNDTIATIEECLLDYTDPIYIVGLMEENKEESTVTTISATIPKDKLIIMNNKYPEWYINVNNNSLKSNNVLFIKDFEQISIEEQKLFIDIICNQRISSELLPENLKIIINSKEACPLISEISEVIQMFEI